MESFNYISFNVQGPSGSKSRFSSATSLAHRSSSAIHLQYNGVQEGEKLQSTNICLAGENTQVSWTTFKNSEFSICINIANRVHKTHQICDYFWYTMNLLQFWRSIYTITQFLVIYSCYSWRQCQILKTS